MNFHLTAGYNVANNNSRIEGVSRSQCRSFAGSQYPIWNAIRIEFYLQVLNSNRRSKDWLAI